MITAKTRATRKRLLKLSHALGYDTPNIYGPHTSYLWYQLQAGSSPTFDLEPEALGQTPEWSWQNYKYLEAAYTEDVLVEAKPPAWWPWWLEDFDLQEALGVSPFGCTVLESGREWSQPWRNWALEQGIAPGQAFCVEVDEPRSVRSCYEVVEYDLEWDAFVAELRPIPVVVAAQRWEHDLRKASVGRALHMALANANARIVNSDVASMYVEQCMYEPGHSHSSWGVPEGRRFILRSKRNLHPCTATCIGVSGEDAKGDFNTAWADFVAKACKANLRLTPDILKSMELKK